MKLPAVMLVLGVLAPAAAAQQPLQQVRGTVHDSAGRALPGALVTVGRRTATADAGGAFVVDSLRPGDYVTTVRLVGFAPVRSRIAVVASEPTVVDFILMPAAYLLPAIVVESRRTGIYGTVGDTGYRAAVGARVQVAGYQGGETFTDSAGHFAFPAADRGQYMVRVTFRGYTERRLLIEVKKGEGKELAIMLAPARETWMANEPGIIQNLGQRLSMGLERDRIAGEDLARYEGRGICDVPRITGEVGRVSTTLILNGSTVFPDFPVPSLCAWRTDEVELIEFGKDVCADVTQTIVEALGTRMNITCSGRTRNVPRSLMAGGVRMRTQNAGTSYVIIWEKR